jgi:hypothetical protein
MALRVEKSQSLRATTPSISHQIFPDARITDGDPGSRLGAAASRDANKND